MGRPRILSDEQRAENKRLAVKKCRAKNKKTTKSRGRPRILSDEQRVDNRKLAMKKWIQNNKDKDKEHRKKQYQKDKN